jgi:glycosyltransferase involved in cell wall biosynthesis
MELPEISIITPLYNSEKFLHRCIDNIRDQTFTNFECILIDDGSTDNSLSICEQYRKSDNRFVVIRQKNSGVSAARNKGLEIARGRYICFMDSDDFSQNNMLEKLVVAIEKSNADVVCCGYIENYTERRISDEDLILDKVSAIEIVHFLEMRQAFGLVWNKLYRKELLDYNKIRFALSTKFGEDMLFNLQYFGQVKSVYISSDCLYNYLHENLNAVTKIKLSLAECNYRFENVSYMFIQIDNNSKSLFCSELLAKDFQYTIALLFRLYSEKKKTNDRLNNIIRLKKFYKENQARNKFTTKVVSITYKLLLFTPAMIFSLYFSSIYLAYLFFVKIGNGKSRFVKD